MKQMKHTKGPWELESRGWDGNFIYGNDERVPNGRRFIAQVSLDFDGAEANARLIAAAPELLQALKAVINSDMAMREEDEGKDSALLSQVRAAIAKAEGPRG